MVFKIERGKHRAGWFFELTTKNKITGTIKFLGDVSYYIELQKDTNKLIGLSDNWYHRKNSARLGWRWNIIERKVEIMTITYSLGKRSIKHLCFTEDNKDFEYEVIINKNHYVYRFDTTISVVPRLSKWKFLRYRLNVYFGGKEPSPKNIYIKIEINE